MNQFKEESNTKLVKWRFSNFTYRKNSLTSFSHASTSLISRLNAWQKTVSCKWVCTVSLLYASRVDNKQSTKIQKRIKLSSHSMVQATYRTKSHTVLSRLVGASKWSEWYSIRVIFLSQSKIRYRINSLKTNAVSNICTPLVYKAHVWET